MVNSKQSSKQFFDRTSHEWLSNGSRLDPIVFWHVIKELWAISFLTIGEYLIFLT